MARRPKPDPLSAATVFLFALGAGILYRVSEGFLFTVAVMLAFAVAINLLARR